MNLLPTAEQDEIASSSRAFLADHLPMAKVRDLIAMSDPVDAAVWRTAAELGWFALGLPEDVDGIGLGLADEALLFREIGRALAPGPYLSTVLSARVAALGGDPTVGAALGAGQHRAGLAIAAGSISIGPDRVSGPIRVLDGVEAAYVLVLDAEGAAVVATQDVSGLESERCIDETSRLSLGRLDDVAPLAFVHAADEPVHRRGLVLSAAMLVGMAEQCRDLCVDHAGARQQFGQPIGTHQAVKHPIADMAVRAAAAWPQVVVAACSVDEGRSDAGFHALGARIAASDAAGRNAAGTIQVLGGMGFTFEHDAHLFVKRAAVVKTTLGGDKALLAALLAEPPV